MAGLKDASKCPVKNHISSYCCYHWQTLKSRQLNHHSVISLFDTSQEKKNTFLRADIIKATHCTLNTTASPNTLKFSAKFHLFVAQVCIISLRERFCMLLSVLGLVKPSPLNVVLNLTFLWCHVVFVLRGGWEQQQR